MDYRNYEIGDIVDVNFNKISVRTLLSDLIKDVDYEILDNDRVIIKQFGEIVNTFGSVFI